MKNEMKNERIWKIIHAIFNIIIAALAFFSIIFDLSWKPFPVGWLIGIVIADSIRLLNNGK